MTIAKEIRITVLSNVYQWNSERLSDSTKPNKKDEERYVKNMQSIIDQIGFLR